MLNLPLTKILVYIHRIESDSEYGEDHLHYVIEENVSTQGDRI